MLEVILTSISEPLHKLGHCGSLLSNGNIDAVEFLLVFTTLVESLLVDYGVNGNCSFAVNMNYVLFTITHFIAHIYTEIAKEEDKYIIL